MKKNLLLIGGCLSLVTGLIGIVLPLLPTTPFLLLATYCFARSSNRLHRWIIQHPWFGPPIHQWQQTHCVSRNTKNIAFFLILLSFTITLVLVPLPLIIKASLLLLALALMWIVARLPESSPSDETGQIRSEPAPSSTEEET